MQPVAPTDPRYKTSLCSHFMESGECPFGAACMYAHGEHEKRDFGAGGTPAPASSWGTAVAPAPITSSWAVRRDPTILVHNCWSTRLSQSTQHARYLSQ